ncbi:transcriptional regulator [Streptomyces longispororuber]|uniref:Transcriptional regulator n=1 Tax=Streptomyces longispororuber TaxID=68230 RepID=A0A918ZEF7_9ACTN|nr:GAF and ANTAR domain-containing protein [Streptomyces longispororuber]GHE47153.1 transcriptional regulator [Streptomyces longispororuber]
MSTTDREMRIAAAVLDLAHRPAGFEPLDLLHDLTTHARALLPVLCAGVIVLDPLDGNKQAAHVTAPDDLCRRIVEFQVDAGEGPCLDSARSQRQLPLTLLTQSGPFPSGWSRFACYARERGITAVATATLRLPGLLLGALSLFMAGPPYCTASDLRLAQTLADAAVAALSGRQALAHQQETIDQLQHALDSRVVIEQAKGILSVRLGVSVDEAFARLRGHARSRRQKIALLASQIAQGGGPPELNPTP